ncbi:MAG: BF3164 family lipoprotein [Rikenellaceae bacterium]
MNKNSFFLIFLNLSLTISCSISGAKEPFSKEIELKSEVWGIADNLGKIYDLAIGDNYLFLRNNTNNTLLSAIPLDNKKEILNFGIQGRATEELISPGSILALGDVVSVYDAGKQSIMEFSFDTDKNTYCLSNKTEIELQGITSIAKLSNSSYAMSGLFPNGRLSILDNKTIKYFSDYSTVSGDIKSQFHILGMAYLSNLSAHNEGKKIAVAYRYAGILEVYNYDNELQNFVKATEYNIFPPSYTTKNYMGYPQFSPNDETRWGYISVTSNDNYIFALYSGKVQRKTTDFSSSDIVDVFDWNGAQICRLKLDAQTSSITADQHKLYSLITDSEKGVDIAEYKLPI